MNDLKFVESPCEVELVQAIGNDEMICKAARVSTIGSASIDSKESSGLIKFLMDNKHGSPFEHGSMTALVECPIFVAREVQRHRVFSYNETSGRYRELEPKFYLPHPHRPTEQVGKPGQYTLTGNPELAKSARNNIYMSSHQAWESYQTMLKDGVAREVARLSLPLNTFTSFYMTGNPRAWMKFFELRIPPQALYEIRMLAIQLAGLFWNNWPITYDHFFANGLIAP